MRRWLRRRREEGPRRRSAQTAHSVLSQDQAHEAFIVVDYSTAFRPQAIRRAVADRMGIEVQIATRYHSAVGDALNGLAKKADPLRELRRVRLSFVPPDVAEMWAAGEHP